MISHPSLPQIKKIFFSVFENYVWIVVGVTIKSIGRISIVCYSDYFSFTDIATPTRFARALDHPLKHICNYFD
jgi:hypothetical protein